MINNLRFNQKNQVLMNLFVSIDLEPAVGISLCHKLLLALEDFHNHGVQTYIDKNQADVAAQWAFDAAKLRIAHQAIQDISL